MATILVAMSNGLWLANQDRQYSLIWINKTVLSVLVFLMISPFFRYWNRLSFVLHKGQPILLNFRQYYFHWGPSLPSEIFECLFHLVEFCFIIHCTDSIIACVEISLWSLWVSWNDNTLILVISVIRNPSFKVMFLFVSFETCMLSIL